MVALLRVSFVLLDQVELVLTNLRSQSGDDLLGIFWPRTRFSSQNEPIYAQLQRPPNVLSFGTRAVVTIRVPHRRIDLCGEQHRLVKSFCDFDDVVLKLRYLLSGSFVCQISACDDYGRSPLNNLRQVLRPRRFDCFKLRNDDGFPYFDFVHSVLKEMDQPVDVFSTLNERLRKHEPYSLIESLAWKCLGLIEKELDNFRVFIAQRVGCDRCTGEIDLGAFPNVQGPLTTNHHRLPIWTARPDRGFIVSIAKHHAITQLLKLRHWWRFDRNLLIIRLAVRI